MAHGCFQTESKVWIHTGTNEELMCKCGPVNVIQTMVDQAGQRPWPLLEQTLMPAVDPCCGTQNCTTKFPSLLWAL